NYTLEKESKYQQRPLTTVRNRTIRRVPLGRRHRNIASARVAQNSLLDRLTTCIGCWYDLQHGVRGAAARAPRARRRRFSRDRRLARSAFASGLDPSIEVSARIGGRG